MYRDVAFFLLWIRIEYVRKSLQYPKWSSNWKELERAQNVFWNIVLTILRIWSTRTMMVVVRIKSQKVDSRWIKVRYYHLSGRNQQTRCRAAERSTWSRNLAFSKCVELVWLNILTFILHDYPTYILFFSWFSLNFAMNREFESLLCCLIDTQRISCKNSAHSMFKFTISSSNTRLPWFHPFRSISFRYLVN